MSVVLIGYRGSGKTTTGRQLASELGWKFFDADEEIVARAGMTIREIFEQQGESGFREMEAAVVRELSPMRDAVIALGGGALGREDNRQTIVQGDHVVVYLRCEPRELHRRIHADAATAANRPPLTKLGGGVEEIESLLAQREPIYRATMHWEIDVTQKSPQQVVGELLPRLRNRRAAISPFDRRTANPSPGA